ncbi:MAG: SRPBCC family protein [Planctomycetaceae bacterium]|nr:SRPBCC family protein [Planctomycetaceae bacterium]
MKPISATRQIHASVEQVFRTVADINNYSAAVPHIIKVEFLSEQQTGVGTRFRETRLMNQREESTILEVTEYVEDEMIRLVSDAGGTIWDSQFTVVPNGDVVDLNMRMEIKPYKLMARLFMPLIRNMVVKGVEKDMDCVKQWCEEHSS